MKNDRFMQRWNTHCDPKLSFIRRHLINNRDFSIICNNCWGGYVYRRYGLPYLTPTVGLFFWADDYIKLCRNLRYYLEECSLAFITVQESKHGDFYEGIGFGEKLIGRLDDIEIVFLHYASEEEAREKWERRAKRVNYENLIFKFRQMNGCTQKDLADFDALDAQKKFMLVSEDSGAYESGIAVQTSGEISNDTTHYSGYINIERLINCESCCGSRMHGIYAEKEK